MSWEIAQVHLYQAPWICLSECFVQYLCFNSGHCSGRSSYYFSKQCLGTPKGQQRGQWKLLENKIKSRKKLYLALLLFYSALSRLVINYKNVFILFIQNKLHKNLNQLQFLAPCKVQPWAKFGVDSHCFWIIDQ